MLKKEKSVIANEVKQSSGIATPYGLAMTESTFCHPEFSSGSHEMLKQVQHDVMAQGGRSMVEMLGVLTIIGVLSVAGIAGYTTAMNQHRANETLNQALRLATIISGQRVLNPNAKLSSSDLAGTNFQMAEDNSQIKLTVSNLPEKVANRITAMNFKNAKVTPGADGSLTFTFENDLSEVSGDSNDTTSDDEGLWDFSQAQSCTDATQCGPCEECLQDLCLKVQAGNCQCPTGTFLFNFGNDVICLSCNANYDVPVSMAPNCVSSCDGKRTRVGEGEDEVCILSSCPSGYFLDGYTCFPDKID